MPIARGALVGWRRAQSDHGIRLTLQVAETAEAYAKRELDVVQIAVNDRQLRSLARDLRRAAEERGIDLEAPRPMLKRLFGF